jgi:hypothetical protein
VPQEPHQQGVSDRYLFYAGHWIEQGSVRLLCVPPEYQVVCSDSRDRTIILGCRTGQILYFCVNDGLALSRFFLTKRFSLGKMTEHWPNLSHRSRRT